MRATPWPTSPCRSCSEPMIWALTENGKPQPFDAEPNPKGNRRLEDRGEVYRGKRVPTAIQHDSGQGDLFGVESIVYMPHHATCSYREKWRKR